MKETNPIIPIILLILSLAGWTMVIVKSNEVSYLIKENIELLDTCGALAIDKVLLEAEIVELKKK